MPEVSKTDAAKLDALNQYSTLEITLAFILSACLGVDHKTGFVVFYRITNNRSRYAIIHDLILKNYAEIAPFWKGLEKKLSSIDQRRNNLVHWVSVSSLNRDTGDVTDPIFQPAHRWIGGTTGGRMDYAQVKALAKETGDTNSIASYFHLFLGPTCLHGHQALRKIFLQPLNSRTQEALHQAVSAAEQQLPPQSFPE